MTVGKHAFSSSSTTEPDTSQSAVDVVDRGALTERWRAILVPGRIPKTGRNPAARPDAAALTQRLVANLTLKRLILLANVEHNKCRPSQLAGLSPHDRPRDPELAWKAPGPRDGEHADAREHRVDAHLDVLRPGADAGLTAARAMPIGPLIGLCERIIAGPYPRCADPGRRLGVALLARRPRNEFGSSPRRSPWSARPDRGFSFG
jgi:hypothetical protein